MSDRASTPEGAGESALRVLVIDDEAPLVRLVRAYLEREGYAVVTGSDGDEAVALARRHAPDVIVLDLMLPGVDGIEACRRIREFSDAYIVMLTARTEEADKIVGLSSGADDYVTKPFSPGELMARIAAMLRRPRSHLAQQSTTERRVGDLMIDLDAREIRRGATRIDLTRIEFDLLEALSARPKVVLSRAQLLERIWGPNWFGDEHVVDVHIANLRHKLDDDPQAPRYIRTIRGIGYRLEDNT